ncbi:peptidase [Bacillus sp. FJAT-27916]|uniref:sporulation peptidase YabG n=1 Tax=Bacillaceae TaxID=186817 RepID=UPI00067095FF|nr:sporulation peptidase YabG [Bacillus sp. FJAT-27916]KMY46168.1 peptidase [Bacillus sp. FJAT-27916]
MVRINDIVGRKSYECDIYFRVIDFRTHQGRDIAVLYGEDIRLVADAPIDDLEPIGEARRAARDRSTNMLVDQSNHLLTQEFERMRHKKEYECTEGYRHQADYFQIPGKVLHLDGDPAYLKKCLELYQQIGIPVHGVHCREKEMPYKIGELLDRYRPDILVITGHDSYSKTKGTVDDIRAYRHSKDFVLTVKEARKKVHHLDQLVIFAGACQSHFESLIVAGANFASSPTRVNIHALDPVYIVAKVSYTSFMDQINVWDVVRNTLTGERGLGGVESKGALRIGLPFHPKEDQVPKNDV